MQIHNCKRYVNRNQGKSLRDEIKELLELNLSVEEIKSKLRYIKPEVIDKVIKDITLVS